MLLTTKEINSGKPLIGNSNSLIETREDTKHGKRKSEMLCLVGTLLMRILLLPSSTTRRLRPSPDSVPSDSKKDIKIFDNIVDLLLSLDGHKTTTLEKEASKLLESTKISPTDGANKPSQLENSANQREEMLLFKSRSLGHSWKILNSQNLTDLPWTNPKRRTLRSVDRSNPTTSHSIESPAELKKLWRKSERVFFSVTTSEDPIIKQFAAENIGEVYATDAILKYLMVCTRSIYPWDVLVHREGERLFLDKRDKSQFDFLSVNETSQEPPEDADRVALGKEATWINQLFSQQVLIKSNEPTVQYEPNPFQQEGENVSATAYRYRKWTLGDYALVARTEIDGVLDEKLLTIKCQNESDVKIQGDWRKTIDTQKGSILATELKNNSYKLAQWTVQALLAGTDNIKLGYVSRSSPKDPTNHVILGSQDYKPKEFAQQISLNMKNAWAVLNYLIEKCMAQPDGEYILMRDPERNMLKLFALPPGEVIKGTE